MGSFSTLFSVLLALSVFVKTVQGHGCVVDPRCRATLRTNSITVPDLNLPDIPSDDCPHCLNGGGKGAVILAAKNKWTPWEPLNDKLPFRHDTGLCGDPVADSVPRAHEVGGRFGPPKSLPFVATYKSGSVIEMTADITTNHNGFFEFIICDVTKCGGDIRESCFKKGHCHLLKRVKTPECESQKSRECGPVDPAYPGRWYVPCRKGGHVGEHFMGGKHMRYQLPAGFNSDHAVLQWYWATANSCNPPGFIEYFERYPMPGWGKCGGDGGAIGGRNPTLSKCGGSTFPEEFWMCADVQVTKSGKADLRAMIPKKFVAPTPTARPSQRPVNAAPSFAPGTPPQVAAEQVKPEPVSGVVAADDCEKKIEFRTEEETKPDPPTATCAKSWKQCGGLFFKGPTECCDKRFQCVQVVKYFAQCKAPRRSGPQKARNMGGWKK